MTRSLSLAALALGIPGLLLVGTLGTPGCGSNDAGVPATEVDAGASPVGDGASVGDAGTLGDPCADPIVWTPGPELPVNVDHQHTFVSTLGGGPALYVVGGAFVQPDKNSDRVYRAAIRDDGSLAPFEDVGTMPEGRAGSALIVDGNTIVLAGGAVGAYPSSSVVIGTLKGDGRIDAWTKGPALPGNRFHPSGALVNGKAYVVGGVSAKGYAQDTIFVASFADGKLGEWSAATPLPEPRSHLALFVRDGALFVAAGLTGNSFSGEYEILDDLLRIPLGADGSPERAVTVRPKPWLNAATHAVTLFDKCFVSFGGGTAAVKRFTLDGEPIEAGAADFPASRMHIHQVPFFRGYFYATAGRALGRPTNQVWVGSPRR